MTTASGGAARVAQPLVPSTESGTTLPAASTAAVESRPQEPAGNEAPAPELAALPDTPDAAGSPATRVILESSGPKEPYPFEAPLPGPGEIRRTPAGRYANLSAATCRAELRRRELPTKAAPRAAPGVATPVRLTGRLGRVRFITPGAQSVYGTLDCRLVLALSDFADLLAEHHVVAVHVDNFYRPKAHLPGRRSKRSQHAYGLAIDVMALTLEDGRVLLVERDYAGEPGGVSCGPGSRPVAATDATIALRNIVCAAARAGLFHHLLTPNYDAAHRDHLHLDIKRDARSVVVH